MSKLVIDQNLKEQLLDSIYENTDIIITVIDTDYKVIFINKKGSKVLGYRQKEIIGKNWLNTFIPEKARDNVKDVFVKLIAGETEPFKYNENPVLTKSGKEKIVSWHNTVMKNKKGEIVAILSSGVDITESKKDKEELEQYKFMVKSAQDAIFYKDSESRYIIVNDKTLETFGLPEEKVIRRNDLEIMPNKEKAKKNIEDDQIVFKTGKPAEITKHMTSIDGKKYWFHAIKVPQFDDSGNITGLVGIARDITEQKRAEKLLRESESKHKTLLENLPQKIFLKDRNSVYISCNENFARDLKIKPDEIAGKTDYDFFPRELAEKYRADDKEIMKSGKIKEIEENYIQDGQEVFVQTVKAPIRGEQGDVVGILGIFWDITERKQREEKIKIFSDAIAGTIDAIVITDMKGIITHVNSAGEKIYRYNKGELIGKSVTILNPKPEIVKQQISTLIKTGSWNGKISQIKKNKETFLALLSLSTIRDEKGNTIAMIGVVRDITELKKAEENLRESEEKYRNLFESSKDGIFFTNMKSRILDCNQTYSNILGYTKEEIKKLTYQQRVPKKWHKIEEDIFENQIMKRGYSDEYEIEYIKKDGTIFPISYKIWLIKDEEGKPKGMWAIVRDITERKKAEEALRKSEEKYRTLYESIKEGIVFTDMSKESNVLDCNQAYLDILGYTKEEINKLTYKKRVPEKWHKIDADIINNQVMVRGYSDEYEKEYIKKDGTVVPVTLRTWLIKDKQGELAGMWAIVRDITEYKKAEDEIKKAHRELKEAQEEMIQTEKLAALGRFSSGVAHEIRNPLANISASAQFCFSKYKLNKSISRHLDIILRNSESANKIVKDLLDFARPGKISLKMDDVRKVIDNTCKLVKTKCLSQNVRLTKKCSRKIPEILLDKKRLEEAFLNFILNALDAMPDRGKLTITAYPDFQSNEVVVSFLDTGVGILQKDLHKIFEPFFTTRADGVGLGLCLAHQAITSHKGKVDIKSKSGEGTEVIVRLPIPRKIKTKNKS